MSPDEKKVIAIEINKDVEKLTDELYCLGSMIHQELDVSSDYEGRFPFAAGISLICGP